MEKLVLLFQNSDPLGLLFLALNAIFCVGIAFYCLYKCIQLAKLYIFDGGDGRVPCLVAFSVIYITTVIVNVWAWSTGRIVAESSLLINLAYVSMVTMMLRGRVLSYPTIFISHFKKTLMLAVGGLLAATAIIGSTALYDSRVFIEITGFSFYQVTNAMYSSLVCTRTLGWEMPVLLWITTIIIEGLIIYFDVTEKRDRLTILKTILLPIATTIYLIFGVFQQELRFLVGTPVVPIAYLFIAFTMFFLFKMDADDVIAKTKKINTMVKSTQRLLNKITNKKRYTHNDIFRFNQILEVIRLYPDVRNSIFLNNYISFNSKKRHIIARLNECYKNPELCRRTETFERLEKNERRA
jgi:hypothetical protein